MVNSSEQAANDIVAAVSDDNGASWVYKNVTFNSIPSGANSPVDPNVILLSDGSIKMFVTMDPDTTGSEKSRTYSAVSTDGGFTYTIEGVRFTLSTSNLLDPEHFRFSDTDWKLWTGGPTPGKNQYAKSTDGGSTFVDQGEFCSALSDDGTTCYVVADILQLSTSSYRMYGFDQTGTAMGIYSLTSTDGNTWSLDSGTRLVLDASAGTEKTTVWAPGVVKLANGNYLMVYETYIP